MSRLQLRLVAFFGVAGAVLVIVLGADGPDLGKLRAAASATRTVTVPGPAVAGAAAQAADPPGDEPAGDGPDVDDTPAAAPATRPAPAAAAKRAGASSQDDADAGDDGEPSAPAAKPSKAKHVLVIALTGTTEQEAFAPTGPAPYLAGTLAKAGTKLPGFRPLDGAYLPNALAAVGGQPPNPATQAECTSFTDFPADAAPSDTGAVNGTGCVYPNTVLTLGDQLTSSKRSWRAYIGTDAASGATGATGAGTGAASQSCRHPDAGAADPTAPGQPLSPDGYATRRNPWVYFHALLDLGGCQANEAPLDQLAKDLRRPSSTANLTWISPDGCASGADAPCADGSPGGLPSTDAFLRTWVPRILTSPAYRQDGALAIVFLASRSAQGAGAAAPPRTGALVLSRYAKRGATLDKPLDPFGLLHTVEDAFAVAPLASAGEATSVAKELLPGAF